jgi:hypothetical protein
MLQNLRPQIQSSDGRFKFIYHDLQLDSNPNSPRNGYELTMSMIRLSLMLGPAGICWSLSIAAGTTNVSIYYNYAIKISRNFFFQKNVAKFFLKYEAQKLMLWLEAQKLMLCAATQESSQIVCTCGFANRMHIRFRKSDVITNHIYCLLIIPMRVRWIHMRVSITILFKILYYSKRFFRPRQYLLSFYRQDWVNHLTGIHWTIY